MARPRRGKTGAHLLGALEAAAEPFMRAAAHSDRFRRAAVVLRCARSMVGDDRRACGLPSRKRIAEMTPHHHRRSSSSKPSEGAFRVRPSGERDHGVGTPFVLVYWEVVMAARSGRATHPRLFCRSKTVCDRCCIGSSIKNSGRNARWSGAPPESPPPLLLRAAPVTLGYARLSREGIFTVSGGACRSSSPALSDRASTGACPLDRVQRSAGVPLTGTATRQSERRKPRRGVRVTRHTVDGVREKTTRTDRPARFFGGISSRSESV
ncbi:hypothetical protein MRX96_016283 [Rhipicephalus microplus]